VERVCLQTPPVHKCYQHGGVHQWHTTSGDEPSKRQEPRTTYERLVPLIPHQGVVYADPKVLQTLWNKIIVKNISPMRYNIIMKSVKYIKPILHTYLSLLRDEASSMYVVPKGLKQGELGGGARLPSRYSIITIC
jgi:hypothetical protein